MEIYYTSLKDCFTFIWPHKTFLGHYLKGRERSCKIINISYSFKKFGGEEKTRDGIGIWAWVETIKKGKGKGGTNWKHPAEHNKGYKRQSQYIRGLIVCTLQGPSSIEFFLSSHTLLSNGLCPLVIQGCTLHLFYSLPPTTFICLLWEVQSLAHSKEKESGFGTGNGFHDWSINSLSTE